MTTLIRNGRIIDPANDRDEIADLLIADGRVAEQSLGKKRGEKIETIDATGLIVSPGLIDIHVHFREPGFGWKETIESGARAAAAGHAIREASDGRTEHDVMALARELAR